MERLSEVTRVPRVLGLLGFMGVLGVLGFLAVLRLLAVRVRPAGVRRRAGGRGARRRTAPS